MVYTTYDRAEAEFCSGILDDQVIEKLKENPRAGFVEAIKKNDAATCLVKTAEIHGHFCPGSALGVMASLYGLSTSLIFEPAYSLPNRESMTKAKDLYRLQAPPHAFSPKEEDDLQYE